MDTTLTKPHLYIIPGWIYNRIIRNKLNIVDINCYSKMREILSLNDLAEWRYLNDEYKIEDSFLSTITMFNYKEKGMSFLNSGYASSITEEQKNEVFASLDILCTSSEIKESCISKLNNTNHYDDKFYMFIPCSNNTLYLVLNEGFETYLNLNESNNKLLFIREFIKNCHNMMPECDVIKLPAYRIYLRQLALL